MSAAYEIENLVREKNRRYGDSIAKSAELLEVLCPGSVPASLYERLHVTVRVLDKISRIMSESASPRDIADAYMDIAGYALLQYELWKPIAEEEE